VEPVFLNWQPALGIAAALAALAAVLRVARHRVFGVVRELALMFGLYGLWVYAGSISIMKTDKALSRGRALWRAEQFLHLPSEAHLQRLVLPHPLAVQAANVYYATVHGVALIVFLVWVFFWHRDRYGRVRNVVALTTGASLAIQLIPVAPPRMLGDLGFVDTALKYHQSVYPALGQGMSDQLSAMPSVHVAWAVLIGVAVVLLGRSRRRWAALAHPAITLAVVVVTANHWWLDGVVAVALLALAVGVDGAARALARSLGGSASAVEADPPNGRRELVAASR
jgi:hypothetical protein